MPMYQCLACCGTGKLSHDYVNADLQERRYSYPCSRCGGTGRILLPVSGRDSAAGERENESSVED